MSNTYYVRGCGARVTLTDADYISQGGQAKVYAKCGVAYRIYHDPKDVIPAQKIQELSVLSRPEIIRPVAELLDSKKRHCGETMAFVSDSFAPQDHSLRPLVLCQLFTNSFRRKHGVTNQHVAKITDNILAIVRHVHDKGIVLVDPNETNWLVHHGLESVFLIDTSCLQTPSFAGNIIKPAIRDWTVKGFTPESDAFSIAVVLAWLWVGIHPYLAYHPDYEHLDSNAALEPRMRKRVSFFDPKTQFNRACRPLDEIPPALRQWLKAVLHDGQRLALPHTIGDVSLAALPAQAVPITSTGAVTIEEIERFDRDIVAVYGEDVVLTQGVVVRTPLKNLRIDASAADGQLIVRNGSSVLPLVCGAERVMESGGRLYAVGRASVNEIVFNEQTTNLRATIRQVAAIADLPTTRTFTGCVIQNLLGRYLLSTFPESGRCETRQLRELEGWQILDAKWERGVFCVMAEQGGSYRLWCYLPDQPPWLISDQFGDVNFTVTSKGVVALITPDGSLCAFRSANAVKVVGFPAADMTLVSRGQYVFGFCGQRLYRVTLS